jgi:hypothetical protein
MATGKPLLPAVRRSPARPEGRATTRAARADRGPGKRSKGTQDTGGLQTASPEGGESRAGGHPPEAGQKGAKLRALSPETKAQLLALPDDHASAVDVSVASIAAEARELQDTLGKYGPTILARSRLSESLITDLPLRLEALLVSESLWRSHHDATLPEAKRALRKEASALRAASLAAFRHFLPRDKALQAEIEDIAQGTSLPALVDDLRRLSPLLAAHAASLTRALLPPDAAARASSLAERLQTGSSGQRTERPPAEEARLLRNRAYWHLRACMDEIRACGRYAYPDSAAMRRLFRGTSSRRKLGIRAPHPARTTPVTPPRSR